MRRRRTDIEKRVYAGTTRSDSDRITRIREFIRATAVLASIFPEVRFCANSRSLASEP